MYDCPKCFQQSAAFHLYQLMLYGGACSLIATDCASGSNDLQPPAHVQNILYACRTLSCVHHPARLHKLGHSTRQTLVALAHHYSWLLPHMALRYLCQQADFFWVFSPLVCSQPDADSAIVCGRTGTWWRLTV